MTSFEYYVNSNFLEEAFVLRNKKTPIFATQNDTRKGQRKDQFDDRMIERLRNATPKTETGHHNALAVIVCSADSVDTLQYRKTF